MKVLEDHGRDSAINSINNYLEIANSAKQQMFQCQMNSRQRGCRTCGEGRVEGRGMLREPSSQPSPGPG